MLGFNQSRMDACRCCANQRTVTNEAISPKQLKNHPVSLCCYKNFTFQTSLLVIIGSILQRHLKHLFKTAAFFRSRPRQGSSARSETLLFISCRSSSHVDAPAGLPYFFRRIPAVAVTVKVYPNRRVCIRLLQTCFLQRSFYRPGSH